MAIEIPNCSAYGNYTTRKFNDIFQDYASFSTTFRATAFSYIISTDTNPDYLELIYLLLFAKYGNSHIANSDEEQFKYKLYATIFQYGPTWIKEMYVQDKLRSLTEAELVTGTKQINDHAFNPSTELESGPNPDSGEIATTNEQTKTRYTKNKMDGYAMLMELLKRDVTEDFMNKFRKLFLVIVEKQLPLWYEGEN